MSRFSLSGDAIGKKIILRVSLFFVGQSQLLAKQKNEVLRE